MKHRENNSHIYMKIESNIRTVTKRYWNWLGMKSNGLVILCICIVNDEEKHIHTCMCIRKSENRKDRVLLVILWIHEFPLLLYEYMILYNISNFTSIALNWSLLKLNLYFIFIWLSRWVKVKQQWKSFVCKNLTFLSRLDICLIWVVKV